MRRVFGYVSAAILLVFPVLLSATFPSVATNTWSAAQPLSAARSGAATVMLQDGRLLITGGNNGTSSIASVDIVDTAGNITAAAPMNMARSQHTATVLQDGRVLVVGGVDVSGNPIGTAEIFDPSVNPAQVNPWTSSGPLVQARSAQTATLLNDGTVLIAGGLSGGQVLNTLELFNAASGANGSFTIVSATLSSPRAKHTAVLLEDGRVMIIGGWDGTMTPPQPPATSGPPNPLATTDIYDASAQQVRAGPALNVGRMSLTATTQLDGQVFVAGGNDGTHDLASTEIFDPITSPQPATFTRSSLSLTTPRSNHLAFLLPHNGGTLLVGGTSNGTAIASAELYMPVYLSQAQTATLTPAAAMNTARAYATGSPLSDGTVTSVNDGLLIVAGGVDASGNTLSSAEFFAFPWVKTDALEYAPGTPVNITGGGFQPGETVTLHFQETPYYDAPADLTATVQPDGTFSNSQFSPDTYDLNIGFFLTATGSASHNQAQTVFADNYSKNNLTIAVSPAAGTPVANSVVAGTNGSGSSDIIGACTTTSGCSNSNAIGSNKTISITATAGTGYVFSSWTVSGAPAGSTCANGSAANPCTLNSGTGNNTTSVTANFLTPVTATLTAAGKVYDGTATEPNASMSCSLTAVHSGDNVTCTATNGSFATPNAGSGTVTAAVALGGSDSAKYVLTSTSATAPATISQKALTYTGLSAPASKIYDATTNATVSGTPTLQTAEAAGAGTTSDGKPYSVDAVSLTGTPSGAYNTKDVATATTVSIGGISLTGTGNGNYSLTAATQSATITPKALTYTGLSAAASKIYDATTNATVTGTATLQPAEAAAAGSTSDGKPYTGDAVSLTGTPTAAYNTKNVATATTVTFGGESLTGASNGNYTLTAATQSATITPKALTYTGLSAAASKIYDATTNATVTGTATLQPAEAAGAGSTSDGKPYTGDAVSLIGTPTGSYDSKDVASATTVTFGGVSLSSTDNSDYSLTVASQPATITAKALTYSGLATAASKTYDATTNATLTGTAALQAAEAAGAGSTSDGKPYSADSVSLTGTATGSYNNKDVALATTVTFAGLSVSGAGSGNYTLTASSQPATITPKAVSVTGLAANNKPYDGTTAAALTGTAVLQLAETPGTGSSADGAPYIGDGVTVTGTASAQFVDKNAANGISVSVTGLSLAGAQIGDYSLTSVALSANIVPATVSATIIGNPTKTYDATTSASLTPANFSLSGLVSGESFTITQTSGSYNSADVTSATTITAILSAGNFVPGTGTLAGNYSLPTTASGAGAITKANATISVSGYSTTYDGNVHTATGSATGVKGETLAGLDLSGTTHTNAGTYATDGWTFSDVTGNYNNASGTVSDNIAKANATISVNAYSVTYDGNSHTATGSASGVKGETLAGLDLSGTAHINAGTYATDAWTFTDATGNYNNTSGSVSDAIAKANAAISVNGYSTIYDGNAHTATGSATGVKGETLAGLDLSGTTHTNAGTYATDAWTFTDATGNYSNANGSVSDAIAKANAAISVNGYSTIYDGNAHTATGSATGVKGETLAGLDLSGTTHTNAGTYATDAWTFTDATGNYSNANGSVSDAIAKANAAISVNGYSTIYDGNAHTATGSATGVKGETLAGLDLSGTTHTNAGTYATDAWAFTDVTANYNNASGSVSDDIAKANATISVSGYSTTYEGNAHTATGSATGVKGETLAGLDLSSTTHTNAGTYATDGWTFTDATGNYNNASGTVSDHIAKANATISVNAYSVTYDGNTHTATGSATGVKGETLAGLDLSGTTHTNAGTYASDPWTFHDPNGNYADGSGAVSDSIGKANAAIGVSGYSVTYDGNSHTATGSATGVKNETLAGLDLSGTTHANAGTYATDAWTFTDAAGNYNNASGTVSDAIARAKAAISVTPYSVTYDGNAHTATGSATGVKGESLSGLDLSNTTHTNPGAYNDSWTFTDATGNYNGASGIAKDAIGYGFLGLEAPYAPPPTTFNVQRTMPIVWQYTNANGAVVNSAAANPQVQIFSCGTIPDNSTQDITVDSAGNSGYQYNSTTNTWQFNWQVKASNLQAGCYDIYIVSGQTGQMSRGFPINITSH